MAQRKAVKESVLSCKTPRICAQFGKRSGHSSLFFINRTLYSDERKLALKILKRVRLKSNYFLGDALYGVSKKVLKEASRIDGEAIVPAKKQSSQQGEGLLEEEDKREVRERREKYRMRYIVEQMIGKMKNGYRERTKSFEMATKYVWVRFIAYNYCVLRALNEKKDKRKKRMKLVFLWFTGLIFEQAHGGLDLYPPPSKIHTILELTASKTRREVVKMACPFLDKCPMFQKLKFDATKKLLINLYCQKDYQKCVRYIKRMKGEEVPDTLLPNGEKLYTQE